MKKTTKRRVPNWDRDKAKAIGDSITREVCQKAVAKYLADGGIITKIVFDDTTYENFLACKSDLRAVDAFLFD